MKKIIKIIIVFIIGIIFGYYINESYKINEIFTHKYKAFQIGVYTNYTTANNYSKKYKDSIIIQDNELYRVYASILKDQQNIDDMSKYLNNNNIEYFIKEIEINDQELIKTIKEYENIMNNDNEMIFLEMNKMIMKKYKESL